MQPQENLIPAAAGHAAGCITQLLPANSVGALRAQTQVRPATLGQVNLITLPRPPAVFFFPPLTFNILHINSTVFFS